MKGFLVVYRKDWRRSRRDPLPENEPKGATDGEDPPDNKKPFQQNAEGLGD